MSPVRRPIPAVTEESRPFWDGAKHGVLKLAKCQDCGHIPFPPRARCPDCLSDSLAWVDLSGRARMRGWTDNYLADFEGHDRPVCIVECALEEDPRAVIAMFDSNGTVRGALPDTPLRITFKEDANGWTYPQAEVDERAGR